MLTLLLRIRTVLLTSDFVSSTQGDRHNSYYPNHPQRAAHFVVFKISVGKDPKILTATATVENLILYAPMAENSTICLHGPMSTFNWLFFQIIRFSGPSLPGMTSSTLQSLFLSGGVIMTMVIAISFAHERKTVPNDCAPELRAE